MTNSTRTRLRLARNDKLRELHPGIVRVNDQNKPSRGWLDQANTGREILPKTDNDYWEEAA